MYISTLAFASIALLSSATAAPTTLLKRAKGKAGISFPIQEPKASVISKLFGSDSALTWWWDWNLRYDPTLFVGDKSKATVDAEFVPMMYDAEFIHKFAVGDDKFKLEEGFKEVMGLNEPDHVGEVATTQDPVSAAADWKEMVKSVRKVSKDAKLHSPGVADDKAWLEKFAEHVCPNFRHTWDDCEFAWDYTQVHKYSRDVKTFTDAVADYHETFNRYVVVSEFACNDFPPEGKGHGIGLSPADTSKFMSETTKWLDEQEFVVKYAWFGAVTDAANLHEVAETNRLLDAAGQLTPLGVQYRKGGRV